MNPQAVFFCLTCRQDSSRGACWDAFAHVAHSGVGGVRAGVRLSRLQHEPVHPDGLLHADLCESQHGDRGSAGLHDYGQWNGLHNWRTDPLEWNRSDNHSRQFQSTDGASPHLGPDHGGDRAGSRADSRLSSVPNAKHLRHDDKRNI